MHELHFTAGGVCLILALFAGLNQTSWKWFLVSFFLSLFCIVIPILLFLLSIFLVPEWKGGARFSWLDCFHLGKFALTPLVLWASAAFYVVQILSPEEERYEKWVISGILNGAVVSTLFFLHALIIHSFSEKMIYLVVPLYASGWYIVLSVKLFKQHRAQIEKYIRPVYFSLPLWILSIWWSATHFSNLSDTPPRNCFVVSSALEGHVRVVGPLKKIKCGDSIRFVNTQILIFWKFEEIWKKNFPDSHRIFRKIYNNTGPYLASCVRTPLMADLIYILLKPLELFARLIIISNTLR